MINPKILKTVESPKVDREKSKELTGYPQIDRIWTKMYSEEALSAEVPEKTLYEIFCSVADKYPNLPAIHYYNLKKISYKKLKKQIDIAASAFRKSGIEKGDVVTLSTANTPENVICFYALSKIGAIANIVDLTLKGDLLKSKIKDKKSKMLITTDLFIDNLTPIMDEIDVSQIVVTSPFNYLPCGVKQIIRNQSHLSTIPSDDRFILWRDFLKCGQKNLIDKKEPFEKDRIACILYTSGTSGPSKGAEFTDRAINAMAVQYRYAGFDFEPGERIFNEEPPFLSYCTILGTNMPLSLGLCIVMYPDYKPEEFADRVYKSKTEHVLGCPADWKNFKEDLKVKKRDYSFIKTAASGGTAFLPDKKSEINTILSSQGNPYGIFEGYGMTEGGSAMCSNLPQYSVLGTVGIPLPLTNIAIYDRQNNCFLKYNEQGEICLSAPTRMEGYKDNEEGTIEAFLKDEDGNIWLRTGDLGKVRSDGGVIVDGREKRTITRHDGYNISPFEIEQVINESNLVEECCVVGKPDTEHESGFVPSAYIVLADDVEDEEITLEDIRKRCQENIIDRNLPGKYTIIDELPRTKVQKVDYRLLEQLEKDLVTQEKDNGRAYTKKVVPNKGGDINEC